MKNNPVKADRNHEFPSSVIITEAFIAFTFRPSIFSLILLSFTSFDMREYQPPLKVPGSFPFFTCSRVKRDWFLAAIQTNSRTSKTIYKRLRLNCLPCFSFWWSRPHKLIIVCLYHFRYKFSCFCPLFSNIFLRLFISGYQVHGPGIKRFVPLSNLPVQGRKILLVFQTLPIRRVRDDKSVFFG